MQENGLAGANFPIGLWKYSMFDEKVFGLKNELQYDIDKYCGIFVTLGDRRLQTSLFQGENLFLEVIQ